jgi:ribosome-associated protein
MLAFARRMRDLQLPNVTVTIPARELEWTAVRASGPGGQNVNKVSSKVELRFDFEGSDALSPTIKARLRALAQHRLDAEGRILITSQVTRNQPQNLQDARARLAELIAKATVAPKKRRPTRPSKAAKRARVTDKRLQSKKKQNRARKTSDD